MSFLWFWDKAQIKFFLLEGRALLWRRSGHISQGLLSLCPCRFRRGIFLRSSFWEPDGVPGSKAHKSVGVSYKAKAPRSFSFYSSPYLVFNNCQHYQLNLTSSWIKWLVLQISRSWLWFSGFTFLSRFQGSGLSANSILFRVQEKLLIFNLSRFSSCKDSSEDLLELKVLYIVFGFCLFWVFLLLFFFVFCFVLLLALPRSLRDLGSPTRDWTRAPCNGSTES